MGKYTSWIPKPIRKKLWPYKARLLGLPLEEILAAEQSRKDWAPLQDTMRSFSERYGTGYILAMLEKGWATPGRMFDELGGIFEQNRKLFVLGNKADVDRVQQDLSFLNVPIGTLALPAQDLLGDQDELKRVSELTSCGYTTLIAYQNASEQQAVATALTVLGKHFLDVNLFYELDFGGFGCRTGDFCSIFSVYTNGKVYLKHQNMLVTTVCNLNCEYCLNYNPYNKHQKHFDLEELKRNVDIYFSHIDRVGLFQLTGGEPSLYPDLSEIIRYVGRNYRNKINKFAFVTNGSTVFSDEFCQILREYQVVPQVDDYTAAVPRLRENYSHLRDKLEQSGAPFEMLPKLDGFVKSFPPLRKNMELTEGELKKKYRACTFGVQNLRDGRLSSCTYFAFAVNAGLIPDDDTEWFDMGAMSDDILSKKKLVEFRSGFDLKGYTNWCRYCNGHYTINPPSAPAAEQVTGHLEWDINNPTYLD